MGYWRLAIDEGSQSLIPNLFSLFFMPQQTIKLTQMAHGGSAIGRPKSGGLVFVPFGIPGETVQISVVKDKGRYAEGQIDKIITPSPDRVTPRCQHFGVCGGCHFQHIAYKRQLALKRELVRDQLERIGGLKNVRVQPTLPHPTPWGYLADVELSPVNDGGLGFWSPGEHRVIPIENCPIVHPRLQALWHDIDLALPGLRKLTLRLGEEEAMLAALEVDEVEPPELEADFPVSVAIVLPDKTAASLIGDPFIVKVVKERPFRVSPGCYFPSSPEAAALVVDTVLAFAKLTGSETVVEPFSGVGMLTAFLAERARAVVAIEMNEDAVADTAVNLDDLDNVSLYEGWLEEVLPVLDVVPQVVVVNPPSSGLTREGMKVVVDKRPLRLIYVSSDVATLARDGKHLSRAGYRLVEIQPIDARPQTFHIDTVSLWEK